MTTELCRMDLIDFMKINSIPNDRMVRYLFGQICSAIAALHTEVKYSHLDIKLENILIDSEYRLKVCDFGFAQPEATDILVRYGTEGYTAPEILNRRQG